MPAMSYPPETLRPDSEREAPDGATWEELYAIVRELAAASPDGDEECCIFCVHVNGVHDPTCLWRRAKELVG